MTFSEKIFPVSSNSQNPYAIVNAIPEGSAFCVWSASRPQSQGAAGRSASFQPDKGNPLCQIRTSLGQSQDGSISAGASAVYFTKNLSSTHSTSKRIWSAHCSACKTPFLTRLPPQAAVSTPRALIYENTAMGSRPPTDEFSSGS